MPTPKKDCKGECPCIVKYKCQIPKCLIKDNNNSIGCKIASCADVYMPVCGWFNSNINCLKYPCASTYSNSCYACSDSKVDYWTNGECPKDDSNNN